LAPSDQPRNRPLDMKNANMIVPYNERLITYILSLSATSSA